MSNTLVTEMVDHLELLPLNLQYHILEIVRALSHPFKKTNNTYAETQQQAARQQIAKLEEQHRRGYELCPVEPDEFNIWESE